MGEAKHTLYIQRRGLSYRNLKVDVLVGIRAHLIVEAELVLARLVGREDKVALALVETLEEDLAVGVGDLVVDVERATRLDLSRQ